MGLGERVAMHLGVALPVSPWSRAGAISGALHDEAATDVHHVVGDHAEPYPALHSAQPTIATAVESVPALEHTDAPLASRPPPLARAEPALLLKSAPLLAAPAAVRNGHARDSHFPNPFFVLLRIETGIVLPVAAPAAAPPRQSPAPASSPCASGRECVSLGPHIRSPPAPCPPTTDPLLASTVPTDPRCPWPAPHATNSVAHAAVGSRSLLRMKSSSAPPPASCSTNSKHQLHKSRRFLHSFCDGK